MACIAEVVLLRECTSKGVAAALVDCFGALLSSLGRREYLRLNASILFGVDVTGAGGQL